MNIKLGINIRELFIEIKNPSVFLWTEVFQEIKQKIQGYLIKLSLVHTSSDKLVFCAICLEGFEGYIETPFMLDKQSACQEGSASINCLIIPTGIGATYGGYAGDANPLARALSVNCDYLLTHPNVVNGAVLSDLPKNIIYLEGFLLEQFLLGVISIIPRKNNRIGVIFDKAISKKRLEYELNVLNATYAFYGADFVGWTLTKEPLDIMPVINEHGFSTGRVNHLDSFIESALRLKNKGATAIAICSCIPDLKFNKEYVSGVGVDPIGGIEALLSHTVSAATGLVSANAPVLTDCEEVDISKINPVSASEYIADTFLPSVISGLRYAPEIIYGDHLLENHLTFQNLKKIFIPYNSFGSPGVMYMNELYPAKVCLVRENKTCLSVDPLHINSKFFIVDSYLKVLDINDLKQSGITPNVLSRPLKRIAEIS